MLSLKESKRRVAMLNAITDAENEHAYPVITQGET